MALHRSTKPTRRRRSGTPNRAGFSLARFCRFTLFAILCACLLCSCASRYFSTLSPAGESVRIKTLGDLPYREIWQGFVFNGEKVGFVHMKIEPLAEGKRYKIYSDAHLRIRFLGMDKKISMKSEDVVAPDLTLVSFRYEQNMDEKILTLDGRITNGMLKVVQRTGTMDEKIQNKNLPLPLYPAGVINLYPVLHGMKVGDSYLYPVYDPQTQSIADVSQSVITFEMSKELGIEPSYKVETHMHGHTVSSWINPRGETVFELGMGGVLITYKETEDRAKSFLAEASLNKKDLIFDFSLIKTDKPVTCPRKAAYLEASVEGVAGMLTPIRGPRQDVEEKLVDGKTTMIYRIHGGTQPKQGNPEPAPDARERYLYLAPSHHIESDHPEIRKAADNAVTGAATNREKVERLTRWVSAEVRDEGEDSFSALEVLRNRKGECQAHTMLYAAMARSLGIPTRLVGGITYLEGTGFLYHAWAESYAEGWLPVDPTFNQVGVDATHIKFVEGPDWTFLLQLGNVIGKISVRIGSYICGP
jgi:hypothetical protein